MSGPRRAVVAIATLTALASCGRSEVTLRDTEGRTFAAKCRGDACELSQTSGPAAPAGKPALRLVTGGWLVGVCNTPDSAREGEPYDCRPLECQTDAQCPPHHKKDSGDCLNGLCVDPAKEIGEADAVMLCLAGTGLGRDGPKQIDRYSMGLNCGSPCKVPKPCRQP